MPLSLKEISDRRTRPGESRHWSNRSQVGESFLNIFTWTNVLLDRYSPLPKFSHRTRFLKFVQLPILEAYHARISSSLDAFETLSSSLLRAVPGALGSVGVSSESMGRAGDPQRLTSGIEGVQRLCKALISARYISVACEAWGEDLVSRPFRYSSTL